MSNVNINIAIIGAVSVGKSTCINSLFIEQYSDMKLKRTTAMPQLYIETDIKKHKMKASIILEKNRRINKKYMDSTLGDNKDMKNYKIEEIEYFVPKISNLIDLKHQDAKIVVYDLPGLNDSGTWEMYYNYVRKSFHKFDIVVLVFDINNGINTTDEKKILELVKEQILNNKKVHDIDTSLIILMNKCDEMNVQSKSDMINYFNDEEHKDNFIQASTIIKNVINNELKYHISPISCEDSYIYRMLKKNTNKCSTKVLEKKHINKIGIDICGKIKWNGKNDDQKDKEIKKFINEGKGISERLRHTGWNLFRKNLKTILSDENQFKYITNHIKYELSNLDHTKSENQINNLSIFKSYDKIMARLSEDCGVDKKIGKDILDSLLISFIEKYDNYHVKKILDGKITDKKSYDLYKVIDNTYNYMCTYFRGIKSILMKNTTTIKARIDTYNVNNILDKSQNIDSIYESLRVIRENKRLDVASIICKDIIPNLHLYKDNKETKQQKISIVKIHITLMNITSTYNDILTTQQLVESILQYLCNYYECNDRFVNYGLYMYKLDVYLNKQEVLNKYKNIFNYLQYTVKRILYSIPKVSMKDSYETDIKGYLLIEKTIMDYMSVA